MRVAAILFYALVCGKSIKAQPVFKFTSEYEYNNMLVKYTGLDTMKYCLHSSIAIRFTLDRNKNVSKISVSKFAPPDMERRIINFVQSTAGMWRTQWAKDLVITNELIVLQTITYFTEAGCAEEPLYFDKTDSNFLKIRNNLSEPQFRSAFFQRRDRKILFHFNEEELQYNLYNRKVVLLPSLSIKGGASD